MQIINVAIGQAGIQISQSLIDLYLAQHRLNHRGLPLQKSSIQSDLKYSREFEKLPAMFKQQKTGEFKPNFLFFDTEPDVINQLRKSSISHILNQDNLASGKQSSGSCYKRAYDSTYCYEGGVDTYMEKIRKTAQCNDNIQAFLFTHSIQGGTGAGLTIRIMEALAIQFPKKIRTNFVLPYHKRASTTIVGNYNTSLALSRMVQYSDMSIMFDNSSLYSLARSHLDIQFPHYTNINSLISQIHSSYTLPMRYNNNILSCSISDIQINLVSYPRIHFAIPSFTPLVPKDMNYRWAETFSEEAMVRMCFKGTNKMINRDRRQTTTGIIHTPQIIASVLLCRGEINQTKIAGDIQKVKSKTKWASYSPTGVKLGISPNKSTQFHTCQPNSFLKSSITSLTSSIQMNSILSTINQNFDQMYSKRAFVHWYIREGMEEAEFQEAREELAAIEKDYQEWDTACNCCGGEEHDDLEQ